MKEYTIGNSRYRFNHDAFKSFLYDYSNKEHEGVINKAISYIAEKTAIGYSTIHNWYCSNEMPSPQKIEDLVLVAEVLGVDFMSLLLRIDDCGAEEHEPEAYKEAIIQNETNLNELKNKNKELTNTIESMHREYMDLMEEKGDLVIRIREMESGIVELKNSVEIWRSKEQKSIMVSKEEKEINERVGLANLIMVLFFFLFHLILQLYNTILCFIQTERMGKLYGLYVSSFVALMVVSLGGVIFFFGYSIMKIPNNTEDTTGLMSNALIRTLVFATVGSASLALI